MANRYKFTTTLEGFVNVYEDSGKFNTRGFHFIIPADSLAKIEDDRIDLINSIKSKESKRLGDGVPVWGDDGKMKYSYGQGDGVRKPIPEPVFVDSTGVPIEKAVLKDVRSGTKVNILLRQKPYAFGSFNTSVRVIGVQIIELATGNGSVDSGNLSAEEVAGMFGVVKGYTQSDPAVRKSEETTGDGESYDF